MSKLRDDEAKKKKLQEEVDTISQIGKEGKEGIKYFQEHMKDEESKVTKKKLLELEAVEKRKRSKIGYNAFLAEILRRNLIGVDWAPGWKYVVEPTELGVILELEAPKKLFFRTAFKSTGDGVLDLNAVYNFVIRVENTVDRIEGRDNANKIILPNG